MFAACFQLSNAVLSKQCEAFPVYSYISSTALITRLRLFLHINLPQRDSIFARTHTCPVPIFCPMDLGPADEYWLDEFVGDDEDWVSKFWQDLNIVDEESAHIGEPPTPAENTTSTAISSIPTSISSSTVGQQRLSNPDNAERIPFNQKWDVLKPEIERLYITENVPLRDLVRIMKEKHDFDAV